MDRRYFAATIAMAATFAVFSHAFGSGLLTELQKPQATLISEMRCAAQALRARLLDQVNRSVGSGSAEEAQLRVELNLPMPAVPAVAPVPPVPPARVAALPPNAPAAPHVSRPARQIATDFRLPENFDQMVQVKVLTLQSRLAARSAQREMARAARAQARANLVQARLNSLHDCRGLRKSIVLSGPALSVHSRAQSQDTDLDRLSDDIMEQVSRDLESSFRNF